MIINKAENIRALDAYCIENLKIPSIVLMENAALKVIKNINMEQYDEFIIVSGKGNNGGDALAVGRHLVAQNKKVYFFIVGDGKGSNDYNVNYESIKSMNCNIEYITEEEDIEKLKDVIIKDSLIIDGIFGTGLNREIHGIFKSVINLLNQCENEIVSIDIPSGLQSDTGEVLGCAIKANKTITFAMYKRGFLNYKAFPYIGEVILEQIGMPKMALDKFDSKEYLVKEDFIKKNFKARNPLNHKGDFGRNLIFAGSKGFVGAAKISSGAAVKSGAGLVMVACHKEVEEILSSSFLEAMCINHGDFKIYELLEKATSIAFGPGMGNNEETLSLLKKVIEKRKSPLVIDADGLNVLAGNLELLKINKEQPIVLTPHLGEMSRLTGFDIEYIKNNKIQVAKSFAKTYNIIIVLKGYNTIITNGEYLYVNTTGNSSMANGGMGDCLTGIITSLIGQKYDPLIATVMSVYIHGFIGEKISENKFVVTAQDIINNLPQTLKYFTY